MSRPPGTPKKSKPATLPYAEADEAGPAAQISCRAADRLRAGHLWVYRSDLEQLIPALGTEHIAPGSIVTLLDSRRIPLGSALFSDSSELTLRKISAEPRVSRGEYLQDTRERIRAALALRAPMLEGDSIKISSLRTTSLEAGSLLGQLPAAWQTGTTDSVRLLFSEADNLPGIIADRYNDLILLQLLTQGTAQNDLRELLAEELAAPGITVILERPDPRIRELENLPAPPPAPLFFSPPVNRNDSRTQGATSAKSDGTNKNQAALEENSQDLATPAARRQADNRESATVAAAIEANSQDLSPLSVERKANSQNPAASAAERKAGHQESSTRNHHQTTFTLNGLRFHYDANSGQKTGAFLDQRLNYAAAARHAATARANLRNTPDSKSDIPELFRALDICTYQGGFALHLAEVCSHVTGVDSSRAALEVAEQNLALNRERNPRLIAEVDWIEADAFELLRSYDAEDRRFETIVLDPPAFAKSRRAVEGALRGYKELNLRALRMLSPGGMLVTCSCSHHISLQAFTETVAAAAADANRHVRLVETRAAAPDHPEVLTLPETRYLKCLILQAG